MKSVINVILLCECINKSDTIFVYIIHVHIDFHTSINTSIVVRARTLLIRSNIVPTKMAADCIEL